MKRENISTQSHIQCLRNESKPTGYDYPTLDTSRTMESLLETPKALMSSPKMMVITGMAMPVPTAPTVPAVMRATSHRSAKENSLWKGTLPIFSCRSSFPSPISNLDGEHSWVVTSEEHEHAYGGLYRNGWGERLDPTVGTTETNNASRDNAERYRPLHPFSEFLQNESWH